MGVQSVFPFLLFILPFVVAMLIEGFVIFFFKLKRLLPAMGFSVLCNLISIGLLYVSSLLLGKLGYGFAGLLVPVQVLLFFWWLSVITDGLLLQLFSAKLEKQKIYVASIVMNSISYLFLYFFISNSH